MKYLLGLVVAAFALLAPLEAAWSAPPKPGEVIRLWPGKAPGTESWTFPETTRSRGGGQVVFNVVDPTVTIYLPERPNGTAVIIAPGGGLRLLSYGEEEVKWLNDRGVAAIVLKYRILQAPPPQPMAMQTPMPGMNRATPELEIKNANANPSPDDPKLTEVLRMATADAQQALRLVRKNAKAWGIDPTKVGMMGFSAGGGVSIAAALGPRGDAYPDFVITAFGPSLQDVTVPEYAPPLFIAVGEMHWNVTNGLVALFQAWKAAGKPAELHIYDMISGTVSMRPRGTPSDLWLEALEAWLQVRGFLPKDGASWVQPDTAPTR